MRTDPPAASADGPAVPPKCHFFNSFFAGKLYRETKRYSYEAVKRWTLEKKLKGYMQVGVWKGGSVEVTSSVGGWSALAAAPLSQHSLLDPAPGHVSVDCSSGVG